MEINWFTFFAQIVNFVILLLLLRHFLYGPITTAMRAREAQLAARFHDAEEARAVAESEAAALALERSEFAAIRDDALTTALADADARRAAMLTEARTEVEARAARWYEGVERGQAAFLQSVRERIEAEVLRVSERALADLADSELETQIADVFAARLLNLSAQDRLALVESGGDFRDDVIIRSGFAMPYAQRQHLVEALQQLVYMGVQMEGPQPAPLTEEIGVRFEQNTDLLCGIELQVHDRRIAWSVRDYLDELNIDLLEAVEMGN